MARVTDRPRRRLRRLWLFLLLVAALALGLRWVFITLYVGAGYVPEADAREYSELAASLAAGQGYRLAGGELTAIRPPLYPVVLAGVYRTVGVSYRAGLALQAVIGALTALAAYAAGKRAYGSAAGRAATLMTAVYPLLIYVGGSLLTEPLFLLLVTLVMAAGLRTLDRPVLGNYLLLGGLLGLAWLTRPNGVLLLPFVLGWLLLAGRAQPAGRESPLGSHLRMFASEDANSSGMPLSTRLLGAAVVAVTALAVAMPWIARNYLVFGKVIPTSTMSGAVLYGAYNDVVLNDPQLHGDWVSPCEIPGAGWSCRLGEVERDVAWQGMGLAFIRSHIADLPRLAWWRFLKFWHFYPFTHGFPESLGFYGYVAVAGLAAVGACLGVRGSFARRAGAPEWRAAEMGGLRRTGVFLAVIACFTVSAVLSWGGYRMRIPAETSLIILAAAAVTATGRRLWSGRCPPATLAATARRGGRRRRQGDMET